MNLVVVSENKICGNAFVATVMKLRLCNKEEFLERVTAYEGKL
jgi:hypothetical protein